VLISLQLIATPQGPAHDEPARSFEEDLVTIGRAPNCQVVLPDGLRIISRQHARLSLQGGEVLLACLSASAPVHVNDVGVPHGSMLPVLSGDVIRIGGFELRLALQAGAAPPSRGVPEPPVAMPPAVPSVPPAVPSVPPESSLPPLPMRRGRARLDEWFDLDPASAPGPTEAAPPAAWAGTAEVDLDLRSGAPPRAPAGAEQRIFKSLQQVLGPRAEAPQVPAAALAQPATPVASPPVQVQVPVQMPVDAPASHAAPDTAPPLDDEARALLMQAFMEGAGLGPRTGATSTQMVAPMALTPAWMRHVGELLRTSIEGSLALLHSRSTVKREMRAEVTVIARRQNNPLKFAPDALAALAHLLSTKRSPGFLEPVAALKDAHEDLLVHHLAVVAGMRAAMYELIARLGPDDVVREEGPPKGLSTLPTLHEAALWRRYRQRHAEMTARLDDDFETVFGREFIKAYEAQARRVRDKAPPEDTGTGS
jgi:type VI secretion system FHA domain protein